MHLQIVVNCEESCTHHYKLLWSYCTQIYENCFKDGKHKEEYNNYKTKHFCYYKFSFHFICSTI